MDRILGLLLCDCDNPLADTLLLGRTCAGHVKAAMLWAGADADAFAQEELSPCAFDTVLCAAEHTPCIGDLRPLTALAKGGPAALVSTQGAPLAFALPAEQLEVFEEPLTLGLLMEAYSDNLQTLTVADEADGIAVTDAESFAAAYRCLQGRIGTRHQKAGVIVPDPVRTVIEADVEIGPGTLIYPGNTLQGSTKIGAGCTLYPGNRLLDAHIGTQTTVENSVLLQCTVGSFTTVGPFAYLRPQTAVGDHCRIGDFVEIKNSSIGDGTKVSHLTYVGDGDLGKHINLGCGVVFTNYDGKQKHRSVVEDNAFIGCNVNLIAPVRIGNAAYVAAGSTVDRDVPADALFIARPEGVVKEGWVTRRREKGKL